MTKIPVEEIEKLKVKKMVRCFGEDPVEITVANREIDKFNKSIDDLIERYKK